MVYGNATKTKTLLTIKQVHHVVVVPQEQLVLVSSKTSQTPWLREGEIEPSEEFIGEQQFHNLRHNRATGDTTDAL